MTFPSPKESFHRSTSPGFQDSFRHKGVNLTTEQVFITPVVVMGVNCITNDRFRDVACDTQNCQRSTFTPVATFITSTDFPFRWVCALFITHSAYVCNTS